MGRRPPAAGPPAPAASKAADRHGAGRTLVFDPHRASLRDPAIDRHYIAVPGRTTATPGARPAPGAPALRRSGDPATRRSGDPAIPRPGAGGCGSSAGSMSTSRLMRTAGSSLLRCCPMSGPPPRAPFWSARSRGTRPSGSRHGGAHGQPRPVPVGVVGPDDPAAAPDQHVAAALYAAHERPGRPRPPHVARRMGSPHTAYARPDHTSHRWTERLARHLHQYTHDRAHAALNYLPPLLPLAQALCTTRPSAASGRHAADLLAHSRTRALAHREVRGPRCAVRGAAAVAGSCGKSRNCAGWPTTWRLDRIRGGGVR